MFCFSRFSRVFEVWKLRVMGGGEVFPCGLKVKVRAVARRAP